MATRSIDRDEGLRKVRSLMTHEHSPFFMWLSEQLAKVRK